MDAADGRGSAGRAEVDLSVGEEFDRLYPPRDTPDPQRDEWRAHWVSRAGRGFCPYSGETIEECHRTDLCDCFDFTPLPRKGWFDEAVSPSARRPPVPPSRWRDGQYVWSRDLAWSRTQQPGFDVLSQF